MGSKRVRFPAATVPADRYKNKQVADPKGEATKVKWLTYYHDHVLNNMSVTEVARKHDINISTAKTAIKWAALQDGGFDKSVYRGAMESRLLNTLKSLDDTLERAKYTFKPKKLIKYLKKLQAAADRINHVNQEAEDDFVKVCHLIHWIVRYVETSASQDVSKELAVHGEIRQTVKMLAQVEKVLGADPEKGGSGGPPVVNITVPPIGRGQGISSAIEIEGEEVSETRPVSMPA